MGRTGPVRPSLETLASRWPTPMRADAERTSDTITNRDGNWSLTGEARAWYTPDVPNGGRMRVGSTATKEQVGLENQVNREWATPTSRDHKDGANPSGSVPTNSLLGRQAPRTTGAGSPGTSGLRLRLNPEFVEWLMGWPRGWTDFAPVATEWCRWWRLMRSEFWRVSS